MKNHFKLGLQNTLNIQNANWDLEDLRILDLTDNTDDPGNTILIIAFLPFYSTEDDLDYSTYEKRIPEMKALLETPFNSQGDYAEELIISTQNNEYLIIYNANR